VNIFQNPKWNQEYVIEIENRFDILANMDDDDTDKTIDEKWESTETFRNKGYNEECKIAIEEVRKAREKCLMKGRRENEE
jgi:hypothetical protein